MRKTKLCKHIKRTMALLLSLIMMWHGGSVLRVSASAEYTEKAGEEILSFPEERNREAGHLEAESQEKRSFEAEETKETGNPETGESQGNSAPGEEEAKETGILEEEKGQESQPLENEEMKEGSSEDIQKNRPDEAKKAADEEEVPEKEELFFEENIPAEETETQDEWEKDKDETADFTITMLSGETAAKAGSTLLYEIQIENTGRTLLEKLQIESRWQEDVLSGLWSREESPEKQEEKAELDFLEPGQKKIFYLKIPLPEERKEKVNTVLCVRAEYSDAETELKKEVFRTVSLVTDIIPLKADFQVTKTADRSMAAPGDEILYQICIRNTGERTLHSVVTTENFQMENISAEFLQKEGVQLNQSRTQAMISKIAPGQAVSLQAAVKLPETLVSQELTNEVTVVAAETGEKETVSQAKVQIFGNSPDRETYQETEAEEAVTEGNGTESRPASSVPKTEDETEVLLWLNLFIVSAAAVFSLPGCLRRKGLGGNRGKMAKRKD